MLSRNIQNKFDTFLFHHYDTLFYIYNNIFKEYQSLLDFETFLQFAFETSSQNGRLYKN